MIPENSSTLNCDIRFGISGLRNPSLTENFYPSDIPEDWLLDYYRNEFSLIFMEISELTSHLGNIQQSDTILADAINELYEDIVGEDFVVLLNVSELAEKRVEQLLEEIFPEAANEDKTLFLINFKNGAVVESPAFAIPLKWQKFSREGNNDLLYYITAEQAIEPVMLKEMIEQIREHARLEETEVANVIFSSAQHALENCRNAILIESMM